MKCQVCGKSIIKSMFSNGVICSPRCFEADFWNNALDEHAIIVNRQCYHAGDGTGNGMGGQEYTFQMFDGRVIKTNDLRYNGVIPLHLYTGDNAELKRG